MAQEMIHTEQAQQIQVAAAKRAKRRAIGREAIAENRGLLDKLAAYDRGEIDGRGRPVRPLAAHR